MTAEEQLINGTNFVQVHEFIKHKWGSDGWDEFNKHHKENCSLIFEERMYPFQQYIDLLKQVESEFDEEDVAYKIGWYRAKHLLLAKGQKHDGMQILSRVAAAWHKFNNYGKVEVGRPDDKTIVIRMSDYHSDPLYCQRMLGFFAALASGGKKDTCSTEEVKCVCKGDEACVFHVTL